MPESIPLSDLALAAFCPRKLYYARRDDTRSTPDRAEAARELSTRYEHLLASGPGAVPEHQVEPTPAQYLETLRATRERLSAWERLVDPGREAVFLEGKDVHGRVQKVLEDPPAPVLVSPGRPPPEGVWEPQSVRAVGAAKALAWERETPVERAYVEYPFHGVIRRVDQTTRRKADYRRALRAARSIDGPPPRVGDDTKCNSCRYADKCGVRTRSLASLLLGG